MDDQYSAYEKKMTDHFVELDLSTEVCLDIVAKVGDTMLMEMLRLGHQAVRDDICATLCFLKFKIAYFAHILLILQLCHNTLTANIATSLTTMSVPYVYVQMYFLKNSLQITQLQLLNATVVSL